MKTILFTASLLAPTLLAPALPAQAPPEASPPPAERAGEAAAKWVQQLGSDSYRDRLEAERRLRELGEAARGALQEAAARSADSEVQWRAKRLLRQFGAEAKPGEAREERRGGLVERRRGRGGDEARPDVVERGGRAPRRVDDVRAEFDRIFKRFEEMGLDVPSRRFFDRPFFRDLESQFGESQFGEGQFGGGLSRAGAGQRMDVRVGPDGVRVEVVEQGEDGKPETKVYEAPDMETFQENHPGVLKGNGLRLGLGGVGFGGLDEQLDKLRGRVGQLERGFDWQLAEPRVVPLPQADIAEVLPAAPAPPAGRRLGVTVKPVPDAVRDYLDLGDRGLMVDGVQGDSLAAACGLQARDIVTKIGSRDVASAADVAAALGAIEKGETVRVEFVRRGAVKVAETVKRHDAPDGRAPMPRKGLQQRAGEQPDKRR